MQKIQILFSILCCTCFFLGYLYALIAILFAMTLSSTFFGPVKYSILPDHLKDSELVAGNSLIEAGTFLSILMGAIFGSLMIRQENGIPIFSLCVIGASVLSWLVSLAIPLASRDDPELQVGWNVFSVTYAVLQYARHERTVWLAVIGISWFWLSGGVFLTQLPHFTKHVIGGNEGINVLWLMLFSLGVAIGSLVCSKLQGESIDGKLVPYGLSGVTLGILCFAMASVSYGHEYAPLIETAHAYPEKMLTITEFLALGIPSFALMASLLLIAFCGGIYIVPLYVMMQHHAPHQYRSRVIAANNILNACFMTISSIGVFMLYSLGLNVMEIFLCVGVINLFIYSVISGINKRG